MAGTDVVMAGFGGQGLMAIGKILAKAAMDEGLQVTWLPSYGPEMRGGTANCVVVIDDQPIGSPVVRQAHAAIVMNKQSIDKFEPTLVDHGLLVINTSLIDRRAERGDLRTVYVAANEVAESEGSGKAANMVMLGAYVGATGIVSPKAVEYAIAKTFEEKPKAAESSVRAFRRGYAAAQGQPS
jgi:2-oxoglutarate ferredoxin oxidoreductase subunit gamma